MHGAPLLVEEEEHGRRRVSQIGAHTQDLHGKAPSMTALGACCCRHASRRRTRLTCTWLEVFVLSFWASPLYFPMAVLAQRSRCLLAGKLLLLSTGFDQHDSLMLGCAIFEPGTLHARLTATVLYPVGQAKY